MKPRYGNKHLRRRLRDLERRYDGLSSEEFITAYAGARVVGDWVYLIVPRHELWAVNVGDAYAWADLCFRLGIFPRWRSIRLRPDEGASRPATGASAPRSGA
jgi:hypothetical protein